MAGTDRNDDAYNNTNYGLTSVDLGAPGVSIYSTLPGSSYGYKTGTSMATPHVAGAAALLWANNPALSLAQVKGRLLNSSDPTAAMAGITLTGGRLNVYNALTCSTGYPRMYITRPTNNGIAILGENTEFQLRLSDCGNVVSGATVTVTPNNGDPVFNLLDDGLAPDESAGDGIYSAYWLPGSAGPVNLSIHATNTGGSDLNDARDLTVIDVPGYSIDSAYPYAWTEISTATDLGLNGIDDGDTEIAIGFDFDFYGSTYNTVWVHTNGMLKFGGSNELSYFEFLGIPDASAPNNYIAPFWEDLNPIVSSGGIFSQVQGSAPNRRLVLQWHDLKHFRQVEAGGPQGTVTFQAILYEGSNDIVVQYQDASFDKPGFNDGARALTGLEFIDGTRGVEYANQVGGLTAGMALLYSPTNSNQRVLSVPENISGGSVTGNQVPQQINCPGDCFGQFATNTVVSLTATPDPGYTFTGWIGGGCSGLHRGPG